MKKSHQIKILYGVLAACVVLMVFFGISLGRELWETRQGRAFFDEISVEFLPRIDVLPVREETRPADSDFPDDADLPDNGEPYAPEAYVEDVQENEPFLDFDALRAEFPSIVGWIQSEGTLINYPIVQAADNDFYLYRLPDGTRHQWGSIFLDYRNAADFSDTNILIYGHNMRSGDKFGSLGYYRRQGFYEQHQTMFIFSPERDFVLRVFAGYVLDSSREVPPMGFASEADFDAFIADITRRSVFASDFLPIFGDTLVFLCTCTEGHVNERLIIVGVLLGI